MSRAIRNSGARNKLTPTSDCMTRFSMVESAVSPGMITPPGMCHRSPKNGSSDGRKVSRTSTEALRRRISARSKLANDVHCTERKECLAREWPLGLLQQLSELLVFRARKHCCLPFFLSNYIRTYFFIKSNIRFTTLHDGLLLRKGALLRAQSPAGECAHTFLQCVQYHPTQPPK